MKDIETRKVLPGNHYEMSTWLDNIKHLDENIPKGFIQTRFLPYHINYPTIRNCYDTIRLFRKKIVRTNTAPRISDASIRVYASWKSCINQLRINFDCALDLWK